MTYKEIVALVAKEASLSEEVVDTTYRAFWYFIRTTIESVSVSPTSSSLETPISFSIPHIGKMGTIQRKVQQEKQEIQ